MTNSFSNHTSFQTGLDRLLADPQPWLHERRVGLVSHPAACTSNLSRSLDALLAAGVRVTAIFGPEHGFSGTATDGAPVDHGIDPRSGLPVFSLFGHGVEPTPEMLAGVDVLLCDLQDVGARFYTYLTTLYHVMKAGAACGIPVIVADRSNPIGGIQVEGPMLEPGFESFVGMLPAPVRHGMTPGELARLVNTECELGTDLDVIILRGWTRDMGFEETGRSWVPTSPAMPHISTCMVYPGMCFLEGTNISEGRGTPLPFEQCGAPWADGFILAGILNRMNLPGVRFHPTQFIPSDSKYSGQECHGVQVHVLDRDALQPVTLGLSVVEAFLRLYPEELSWQVDHFDHLAGCAWLRQGLQAGTPALELAKNWAEDCAIFVEKRTSYLLYETQKLPMIS